MTMPNRGPQSRPTAQEIRDREAAVLLQEQEAERVVQEKAADAAYDAEQAEAAKQQAETLPGEFKFRKGRPLPVGFENPPLGDIEHRCVDLLGNYAPKWMQVKIFKHRDDQRDPQSFGPADQTYKVRLGVWVDVPPGVIHALDGAVETHHQQILTDQNLISGTSPPMVSSERPRFMYQVLPSA